MDENQVQSQLNQMQNFIMQEAEDKASEIRAKSQEEFSIQKAAIVVVEKQKITKEYERKEKQIGIKKKIDASNELNLARLRVLKSRDDVLQRLLVEAQQQLSKIGQSDQYPAILHKLIIQALVRLGEAKVQVVGRKEDRHLIESVLNQVKQEYKEKTGQAVDLKIDENNFLPPGPTPGHKGATCSGGIILSAHEGKMLCRNTLDARLGLAFEQRLPEIRTTLFGKSKSRVHYD
jgi:V-type H+-transporting ATPase subunit E